jgi:triosephosphate isomerase
MHGTQSDCLERARQIAEDLNQKPASVEVAVAPPFTALAAVKEAIRNSKIHLAAQNCHWQEKGAFTGEVSPTMLRDIGCDFVILGHSERRHLFHESDSLVAHKLAAALANGLRIILCVGETLRERRSRQTSRIISRQLRIALKGVMRNAIDKIEIAYEPVWAIGTGRTATPELAQEAHAFVKRLIDVPVLYGGSVKPENAEALLSRPDVDGALVGGASLEGDSFTAICRAAAAVARA